MTLPKVIVQYAETERERFCQKDWQQLLAALCCQVQDVQSRVVSNLVQWIREPFGQNVSRCALRQGFAEGFVLQVLCTVSKPVQAALT